MKFTRNKRNCKKLDKTNKIKQINESPFNRQLYKKLIGVAKDKVILRFQQM